MQGAGKVSRNKVQGFLCGVKLVAVCSFLITEESCRLAFEIHKCINVFRYLPWQFHWKKVQTFTAMFTAFVY